MVTGVVILFIILSIVSSFLVGLVFGLIYTEFVLQQSATLPIIAAVIAAVTGAITLVISLVKSIVDLQRKPRLKYLIQRIEMRTREDRTNERRFSYIEYFLPIKNTASGIKAKDCEGFITVLNTDIEKHRILWESNRYNIDIGYEELLRLFKITETWVGQTLERRTITFSPNAIEQLEPDGDINGRRISVRIQSDNAECPTKAFEAAIHEVITNVYS